MRHARGFTLLEVLVAILFAAWVLVELFQTPGDVSHRLASMRTGTYAHLVASNVLAELRVRRSWPAPGNTQGTSEMATQRWEWQVQVEATDDPAIRRVRIEVFDANHDSAAMLYGYLGQPGGG